MAGGEGTRLRPLTSNQPKPMLPVANRPMMEHIVQLLQRRIGDGRQFAVAGQRVVDIGQHGADAAPRRQWPFGQGTHHWGRIR